MKLLIDNEMFENLLKMCLMILENIDLTKDSGNVDIGELKNIENLNPTKIVRNQV